MEKVILIDDERFILDALIRCLGDIDADFFTFSSPLKALEFAATNRPDLVITDQRMPLLCGIEVVEKIKKQWPLCQCILLSAYHDFDVVASAFNQQLIERFICKPWDDEELVFVVAKALKNLAEEPALKEKQITRHQPDCFHGIVTEEQSMQLVFDRVSKAATANVPIFITGETGTGKELVAKACHMEGFRKNRPFIAFNCANFSDNLIESQLFGHRKGAFTGADADREGLLAAADNGTLFLDEVTTLPLPLQAKLLRVIQEREFSPLGSHKLLPFTAQLVTASSTALSTAVAQGSFREDLYYRLNVLVIDLPPLRERGSDILLLANDFLARYAELENKTLHGFSKSAMVILADYHWPGNIRQLENFVHSVVILSSEAEISETQCLDGLQQFSVKSITSDAGSSNQLNSVEADAAVELSKVSAEPVSVMPLWAVEKNAIEKAIEVCDGNVPKAAAMLEVSPSTLYRKLQNWQK